MGECGEASPNRVIDKSILAALIFLILMALKFSTAVDGGSGRSSCRIPLRATPAGPSRGRQEVVMLMGEAIGGQRTRILKVVRTDAGGFFGLTELEGLPVDKFQGRFVQLMPTKTPPISLTHVAKAMLTVKGLNEQKLRGTPRRR